MCPKVNKILKINKILSFKKKNSMSCVKEQQLFNKINFFSWIELKTPTDPSCW